MAYGTTVKFTNRTRTTVKLFFVKFPTVKYNIRENKNREIIINICIICIYIYITYIYTYNIVYIYTKYVNKYKYYKNIYVIM